MRGIMMARLQANTNNRLDVSSYVKISRHFKATGLKVFIQHVKNHIRDSFMRHTFVAKAIQVQLQAFQLDNPFIRYI